jgi:hypothetical protein
MRLYPVTSTHQTSAYWIFETLSTVTAIVIAVKIKHKIGPNFNNKNSKSEEEKQT